jgi:uroporphyrinogen-III synthase
MAVSSGRVTSVSKAAGAIHSLGLEVVARPESERLADCVSLVLEELAPGARVVLQRDGGPPPVSVQRLRAAGAEVLQVPVYRWERPSDQRAALRLVDAVVAGRVHALTFTSAPAVGSLLELAGGAGMAAPLRAVLGGGDVVVGCVGPVCAEAAVAAGLGGADLVQPRTYRLGPLVHAVACRLEERRVRVAGLELSGTVVRCGDRRVELSHIEARLLSVLAARAGAVVSKDDLLREVWRDPGGDPHVVEVAVARLRHRLGRDGAVVTTVTRRGYALR